MFHRSSTAYRGGSKSFFKWSRWIWRQWGYSYRERDQNCRPDLLKKKKKTNIIKSRIYVGLVVRLFVGHGFTRSLFCPRVGLFVRVPNAIYSENYPVRNNSFFTWFDRWSQGNLISCDLNGSHINCLTNKSPICELRSLIITYCVENICPGKRYFHCEGKTKERDCCPSC